MRFVGSLSFHALIISVEKQEVVTQTTKDTAFYALFIVMVAVIILVAIGMSRGLKSAKKDSRQAEGDHE